MKPCPYCAEEIQDAAVACKHCGRDLATGTVAAAKASANPGVAAVLSFLVPGLGQMYGGRIGVGFVWLFAVVLGYFLLVVPGLVLHILCIVTAYRGAGRV